jgi:hypothetical protein
MTCNLVDHCRHFGGIFFAGRALFTPEDGSTRSSNYFILLRYTYFKSILTLSGHLTQMVTLGSNLGQENLEVYRVFPRPYIKIQKLHL